MSPQSTAPERPAIAPPAGWRFPEPTTRELDNGLHVWTFDLPGQYVVSANLVLDAPLDAEPAERQGVATITARTSDEGTRPHPGQKLLDLMEASGAAYDASVGASATVVGIDVPSTRVETALPLLAEVVQQADHAPADVERHVALRLAEIEQTRVSAPSLAALGVRQALFDPSTRVSRAFGGRTATVSAITCDDVRAFRALQWGPQGATLILAGELDGDIDRQVDDLFAGWAPTGAAPLHRAPLPGSLEAPRRVQLVDLPGAVQTEIRIAGIGVDRTSPDFAPLQVASTALGGSFGSRLNTVLREERGYTYGAHLGVQPARLGGTWSMQTSVRTEVTAAALADALRILGLEDALTDDEVGDAIRYQVGIAPLRYDTAAAIAHQAAGLAGAGWGAEFVNLHFTRMAQVTATTATEAARRILDPSCARIVLVGDASVLNGQLRAAGFDVEPLVVDL